MRGVPAVLAVLLFTAGAVLFGQISGPSSDEPVEVTAGRSVYQWEIKRILLENTNRQMPVITQGQSVLRANTIIYDDKQEIGYAFGNVNYQNKKDQVVLTAGEGTYDTKKKEVIARRNPKLHMQKDDVTARSEVMKIYPDREYTLFVGNVRITNRKFLMEGDQGTMFGKSGRFKMTGNARATQEDTVLEADKIDLESKNGQMQNYTAQGGVKVTDVKQGYEIRSGRLDYFKDMGYTRMTQKPVLVFTNRNITAYAIVMEKYDNEDKANLLGDVVIVQGNKKAYAKWGEYFTGDKRMVLTGNPVLVQGKSRFNSSRIIVDVEAGTMNMVGTGSGFYEYRR